MFSVILRLRSCSLSIFVALVFWNIFRKEDTLYNGCSVCVSVVDGALAITFPGASHKRNRNWETAEKTHFLGPFGDVDFLNKRVHGFSLTCHCEMYYFMTILQFNGAQGICHTQVRFW